MTTLAFTAAAYFAVAGLLSGFGPDVTGGPGSSAPEGQADPAVTRYAGPTAPLADRWTWAASEAKKQGFAKGYWAGYTIEKTMGERSFIGSFHSDERKNRPSLGEIVTGMQVNDVPPYPSGEFGEMSGFVTYDDEKRPAKLVKKEVGILLHIGGSDMKGGDPEGVDAVAVSNLSLRVDLDGDPLLWLGAAGDDESVGFLDQRYRHASSTEAKKRFVVAIGIHDESEKAVGILKGILTGEADMDLRGDAAFWLGQTGAPAARTALNDVAWKDGSEEVREKCVFALSRMEDAASLDALIALAQKHGDDETRKHAAFWLGQKASDKAVGALKEIAYNDADTEVQRSALFALTRADDGRGNVEELVRIARNHPNPEIRKNAIFWLGQSEDPKAVDALVEMAKGR